jgi:hypothetical protein
MAVATAPIVTPAQATRASSRMFAEHVKLPFPPVAGCRPARASPPQAGTRHDRDREAPQRVSAYERFPVASFGVLFLPSARVYFPWELRVVARRRTGNAVYSRQLGKVGWL